MTKRIEMTPTAVYWIEKATALIEGGAWKRDAEQEHCFLVEADGKQLLWSGGPIPAVGEAVKGPGQFGTCIVRGYFTEDGYFGVLMTPLEAGSKNWVEREREERWNRTNPLGFGNIGCFGSEFDLIDGPKPKHPGLTPDQLVALALFALANGRTWKSKLQTVWLNGHYASVDCGGADSCYLQQVRNSFGPRWLQTFSVKAAL